MNDRHTRLIAESPQRFRWTADSDLDGSFRIEHTVFYSYSEGTAMMVLVSKELRAGITMRIEVDHAARLAQLV